MVEQVSSTVLWYNSSLVQSLVVFVISTVCLVQLVNNWTKKHHLAKKVEQRQAEREENLETLRGGLIQDRTLMTPRRKAIVEMDFCQLQCQLQSGTVTAVEAVQAFQAKALHVQKSTNAVVGFLKDALDRARELDKTPIDERKPLHGLPISLKEHINIKGLDSTVGIPGNIGKISEEDAGIVLVLKKLGAVPFCRTNLSQTLLSFDCSNPIYGATLNPRNLTRSPGGSSGGEGALIAGGGSVMGFGSDCGGSVRMPAMFCGVTSLKPTSGRIPNTGQGSDGGLVGAVGILNTVGLMSRSVADIGVCFKAILSLENIAVLTADPRLVHLPWRESETKPDTNKLKIGWYDYNGSFKATPGARRAVAVAKQALEKLGHQLVQYCPPDLAGVNILYGQLMTADEGESTKALLKNGKIDYQSIGLISRIWSIPDSIKRVVAPLIGCISSPIIAGMITDQFAANKSKNLWKKNALRLDLIHNILKDWEANGIDAIIAPSHAIPAQPPGYPAWEVAAISYTSVYNLLDFPAGSLPITFETEEDQDMLKNNYPGKEVDAMYGWVKDGTIGAHGMPLNVQVIGRPWCEEMVLRVMQELQTNVDPGIPIHL